MKNLSIMLKPASSLCNLRCKYCFYSDVSSLREIASYGIMSADVTQKILQNIFEDVKAGDTINFLFQGGEPTLAGLDYYENFVQIVSMLNPGANIGYAFQTNAVLITDQWCNFFRANSFLVGLSLDGPKDIHDLNRVDVAGKGSYEAVTKAKKLLDNHQVPYNVLMTLTNHMARFPRKVWQFIIQNHLQYVQFTPCISSMECAKDSAGYALTPKRFSGFYKQIFSCWLEEWKRGNYYSIKLIDDLLILLSRSEISSCGLTGNCTTQIVIEADGSTFPCDFYMLDQYCTGNLCSNSLKAVYNAPAAAQFKNDNVKPELCINCRFQTICGGSCKRMRTNTCIASNGTYCGYKDFLDYAINDLLAIARSLIS